MIKTFTHKGLERFFLHGDSKGMSTKHLKRIERILDRLGACAQATDMNLPGYEFHSLKGNRKGSYAVKVSGNWRITFRFEKGHIFDVNYEDYH